MELGDLFWAIGLKTRFVCRRKGKTLSKSGETQRGMQRSHAADGLAYMFPPYRLPFNAQSFSKTIIHSTATIIRMKRRKSNPTIIQDALPKITTKNLPDTNAHRSHPARWSE
jgi:hypothetical protein